MPEPLLTTTGLRAGYGGKPVLQGVDLAVQPGEIVAVIGRNGVGKSTLMRSLIGLLPPQQGTVLFKGAEINGVSAHRRARLGIGYVPQGRDVFPRMSIYENLLVGQSIDGSGKGDVKERIDRIYGYFPILKERRDQHAGTMSGGQQQTLAMARTMILKPDIVMLDEPSLGLAPKIVQEMFSIMKMMAAEGITILLVEQNALMGLKNSDQGVVLDLGRTLFSGPADDVLRDPRIQDLYLGGKKAA